MQAPTQAEFDEAMHHFSRAEPGIAGLLRILDAPQDFLVAFLQTQGYLPRPEKPAPWYRRATWLRLAWRAGRERLVSR